MTYHVIRHAIAALAIFLFAASGVVAAPITYDLQDYPSFQSGYTLSGVIVTDGALGSVTDANILNWNVTIAQGAASETFSSISPGAHSFATAFLATASELLLPNDGSSLRLSSGPLSADGAEDQLFWNNFDSRTQYLAVNGNGHNLAWNASPSSLGRADLEWVITKAAVAVPEPSTIGLSVSALLLLIATFGRRRRKVHAVQFAGA